jgi:hypothetical protein
MVCPFSLCGRLPSWGNPVGAEIGSISEQQLVRPSGFICWVTDRGYQADKKICKIVALTVRRVDSVDGRSVKRARMAH